MNTLNKEVLEHYLGYEIVDFEIVPVYSSNKFSGFEIKIQPKQKIEFLDINFKISPTNGQ